MVRGSLALLLFIGLYLPLGSRAAAQIGNKVLQNGEILCLSISLSAHPSVCPSVPPLGRPAKPKAQPAWPEARGLKPEAWLAGGTTVLDGLGLRTRAITSIHQLLFVSGLKVNLQNTFYELKPIMKFHWFMSKSFHYYSNKHCVASVGGCCAIFFKK